MKKLLLFATTFISLSAYTQTAATAISLTQNELNKYLVNKEQINQATTQCMNSIWDIHINFYNQYGMSKYYGDRNPDLNTRAKRLSIIQEAGVDPKVVDMQEPISCIGLTMRCLGVGFRSTQDANVIQLWKKIENIVHANGVSGVVLIQNLQKLGWKVMYWNPEPASNKIWDAEDVINFKDTKIVKWDSGVKNEFGQNVFNVGWGQHQAFYRQVVTKNLYYGIRVDDKSTLVDMKNNIPESFKQAPLFVGVAHAGYHVFPGMFGEVIEAHSMRRLNSIMNLERAPFNPYIGGAPMWTNSEKYRSGLVAVPPGY